MYRIRDLQFDCRYFADGKIFKSKKEICKQLIDYHSIDCNMSEEKKLFKKNKVEKCLQSLKQFEWEIEEIKCEQCMNNKLQLLDKNTISRCLNYDYKKEV